MIDTLFIAQVNITIYLFFIIIKLFIIKIYSIYLIYLLIITNIFSIFIFQL
jgi:hypothetical protein